MAKILWTGPSLFTGEPIFVAGSGDDNASDNIKTGNMQQLWIMPEASKPSEAVKNGDDRAVCADCVHRMDPDVDAKISCYLNHGQAPNSIFRARKPEMDAREFCRGKENRLGAWGDPSAAPFEFWDYALSEAAGWLGYTEQWRTCDQRMKKFCMASVHLREEYDEAHDLGWRCFFDGLSLDDKPERAALCPASAEAGKVMQCIECKHCCGLSSTRVGDVFIVAHGTEWKVMAYRMKLDGYRMKRYPVRKAA